MKKIIIVVSYILASSSLFAAEFTQEKSNLLVSLIKKSLLNKENAFDGLDAFFKLHQEVLQANDSELLKTLLITDNLTLPRFFDLLDPEIFERQKDVASLLGFTVGPSKPRLKREKGRVVADIMVKYIEAGILARNNRSKNLFDFEFVEHAYKKHPICVDRYWYIPKGDDSDTTIGQELDRYYEYNIKIKSLDFPDWLFQISTLISGIDGLGVLPYMLRMSSEGRDRSIAKEFNKQLFGNLVIKAVLEWQTHSLFDLKVFVEAHKADIPSIDDFYLDSDIQVSDYLKCYHDQSKFAEDTTLGRFIDSLNPTFYTNRNEILSLIAPSRKLPDDSQHNKEGVARMYQVNIIKNFLSSGGVSQKEGFVEFLCKKYPICLDDYPYDDVRTLGTALDHKRFRVSEFKIFGMGFRQSTHNARKKDSHRFGDKNALMDLIALCLIHEKPEELMNDLKSFSFQFGSYEKKSERRTLFSDVTIERSHISFEDFFDRLNPQLFPRKEEVERCVFGNADHKGHKKYTQEADKAFIENLILASMNSPELVKLVQHAYERYEQVYGTKPNLVGDEIDYDAWTTLSAYMASHQDMPQYAVYKELFPESFFVVKERKKRRNNLVPDANHGEGDIKITVMGQDVEWGKLLIATALICVGGYFWYKKRKASNMQMHEKTSQKLKTLKPTQVNPNYETNQGVV